MNKKPVFIVSLIICSVMLSATASAADMSVWVISDPQPDYNSYKWKNFQTTINDMNKVEYDFTISAGDLTDFYRTQDNNTFSDWIEYFDNLTEREFYPLPGNHDYDGTDTLDYNDYIINFHNYYADSNPSIPKGSLNYTVQKGNILFIFLPYDSPDVGAQDFHNFSNSYNYLKWYDKTVRENQDKIIITVSHTPIYNTTAGSTICGDYTQPIEYISVLQDYKVDLWIHGHNHREHSMPDLIVRKYGTAHINNGAIDNKHSINMESRILVFEDGSEYLIIKSRNHKTGRFQDGYSYIHKLSRPFNSTYNTTGKRYVKEPLEPVNISEIAEINKSQYCKKIPKKNQPIKTEDLKKLFLVSMFEVVVILSFLAS